MIHSVTAVSTTGRIGYGHDRGKDSSDREKQADGRSFSKILQQEVEDRQTDSVHCKTVTYGRDRRIHPFEYYVREYNM